MPPPGDDALEKLTAQLADATGLTIPNLARIVRCDRSHLWRVLKEDTTRRGHNGDILGRCLIAIGTVLRNRDQAQRRVVEELMHDPSNGDAA